MILNPESINNKIEVREVVGRYLIYDCHLTVLAVDTAKSGENIYIFRDTAELRIGIKNMPVFMKLFYGFGLLNYW